MPKDTKTLGNNKARACESLGFVHKKRLCQRFDTTSSYSFIPSYYCSLNDTGTVNFTRTFLPFCTPGVHFGIELITRIASLSK